MHPSFATFLPLLALVLGLKHGMDADHLATIDGLTRFNFHAGRIRLARFCGFFFSLGHGIVVCIVATMDSVLFARVSLPQWLDASGLWISTFFLLLLGVLNLHAVFSTPADEMVSVAGFKGRYLRGLNRAASPLPVMLVGALFAVSFDTLSQAALFSSAASQFDSAFYALAQALFFMFGMMALDALNGLWLAQLLRRADGRARIASRIMGLTVALLSLVVAGLGLSRHFLPQVAAWQQGRELFIGSMVLCVVLASFVFARYRQRGAAIEG